MTVGAVRGRSPLGQGFVLLAAISLLALLFGPGAPVPAGADSTSSLFLSLRTRCGEIMGHETADVRATLTTAEGIGAPALS